jgi:hypothetical protein
MLGVYALVVRERMVSPDNRTSVQIIRAQIIDAKFLSTLLPIVTLVAPSDPFPPWRTLRRRGVGVRRDTAFKEVIPVPSK